MQPSTISTTVANQTMAIREFYFRLANHLGRDNGDRCEVWARRGSCYMGPDKMLPLLRYRVQNQLGGDAANNISTNSRAQNGTGRSAPILVISVVRLVFLSVCS